MELNRLYHSLITAWRIRQMQRRGALKLLLISARRRKFALVLSLRDLVRQRNAIREIIWKNYDTGSSLVRPTPPPPPPPFPTAATSPLSDPLVEASEREFGADASGAKPATREIGVQAWLSPDEEHANKVCTTLTSSASEAGPGSKKEICSGEQVGSVVTDAKVTKASTNAGSDEAITKMEERLRADFRALQSRNEDLERLLRRVLVRIPPCEDHAINTSYNEAHWRIHM